MNDLIRHAIARGEFTRAASLLEEWTRSLAESRNAVEWEQWSELYAWARETAVCSRAQLQDHWNALGAARAYVTYP